MHVHVNAKHLNAFFLKELYHGNSQVFGQNCLKLELSTLIVQELLLEH